MIKKREESCLKGILGRAGGGSRNEGKPEVVMNPSWMVRKGKAEGRTGWSM